MNQDTSDLPHPGRDLDRWAHAQLAPFNRGVSTASLRMAFDDWLTHLSHNPAEQLELAMEASLMSRQFAAYALQAGTSKCAPCIEPMVQDRRFADPAWQQFPFNVMSQAFLMTQKWWQDATTGVRGVSPHHEQVVSFTLRQWLDLFSPANFVPSNPEVLARTLQSRGANLWNGWQNYLEDLQRLRSDAPPEGAEAYRVGREVAATPGQVIFRNELIELIQYAPAGKTVRPEPILIVPSWIMKYYILDLSPHNSMIKYLVEQGHQVFAISWRNPGAAQRGLGMEDYAQLGVMAALEAVGQVMPRRPVHAVGYCLGGTLLAAVAAAMARDGDERLASISLFAAQTDFTEPGELALFIDESQVSYLEDLMWDKGYLDDKQMSGAFQLLNSTDLIWSRMLKQYLMGERAPLSDLMAWNADGTRLPYRMHTEYLRQMFLGNDLASGRFPVGGRPVALSDIRAPIYCVGTLRDHVAPWQSVHKLHLLTDVALTFTLSSGGHNVGIVNPPPAPGEAPNPKRGFQSLTRVHDGRYLDPEEWQAAAPQHEGSWWPHWEAWLQARSGKPVAPPSMGAPKRGLAPLCPAPGTYVMQR